jgi:two-component system OmpR family response regulator
VSSKAGLAKSSEDSEASRPTRVIVVDDDPGMQRIVSEYLEANGIEVSVATGRRDMTRLLAVGNFSMVVLDLRLGREDGLDLLRELRAESDLPVIIITGHRRDEVDRVVGLELGADDYLTKPFSLRELLARIRVVLRRVEAVRVAPTPDPASGKSRFCGWTLDRRQRRLTDPDGATVGLTKGEYALLVTFLDAPLRPLSREQLLQSTRVHEDIFDRSIDVQILRLRRKLETDPTSPTMIRTERGIGYVFAVPVETTR